MAELEHGPECDCGCCGEEEEELTITLEFDDGESVVATPLFVFDFEGTDYVALVPVDEESEDVYLYEYIEISDDEFEFADIEDDDVFDKVAAKFEELMEQYEESEGEE